VNGYTVAEYGEAEVLRWGPIEVRAPAENEVVVDVAYAGVNFLDVHQRSGKYPRPLPFVPGNEGSGIVAAAGSRVDGLAPGDRVAFAMHGEGSYAERVVVNAERVARVPDAVALDEAAGVLLQGVTALCLVDEEARVAPGQTVLVHSASGGAGAAITQIARHAGATVLGLVSTEGKRELALAAGAHDAALYTDHGGRYSEWVAERTGGHGVAAVFDAVGGDLIAEDLASLGRRGHLVLYGQTSGPFSPISPDTLAARSLTVTYSRVSAYIIEPGAFRALAERLLAMVAAGGFAAANLTELDAEQAADAHRALVERTSRGKIVLRVCGE
jgi:NADPH2:quinone reductase